MIPSKLNTFSSEKKQSEAEKRREYVRKVLTAIADLRSRINQKGKTAAVGQVQAMKEDVVARAAEMDGDEFDMILEELRRLVNELGLELERDEREELFELCEMNRLETQMFMSRAIEGRV